MTNLFENGVLIAAIHELHTNHSREFETLDQVDPATGEFAIRAKTVILTAGRCHLVPAALADELFAMAAKQTALGIGPCVREPEEREILSFRQGRGDFSA